MSLPTGWTIQVNAIRAQFGPGGTNPAAHVDYNILDASGNSVGGGTHSLYQRGPQQSDPFTTDGKTTTLTTSKAPYGGTNQTVTLNGSVVTTGVTFTTNTDGTVTATFTKAPAAPASASRATNNLTLSYPLGPSLTNAAGDLPTVLGLTSGSGTVWSGTVGGQSLSSAHENVTDLAALLLAWATVRVVDDRF